MNKNQSNYKIWHQVYNEIKCKTMPQCNWNQTIHQNYVNLANAVYQVKYGYNQVVIKQQIAQFTLLLPRILI